MGFLKWNVITNTMFHRAKTVELEFLKQQADWEIVKKALVESTVGNPKPYRGMRTSSGNLIHQAYSLYRFMETNRLEIDDLHQIVEFGGGYGCMCRLIHNLGFQGKYIIYDLPEFSALQSYYLSLARPGNQSYSNVANEPRTVVLLSNLEDLKKQIKLDERTDLFIALWSLSETPHTLRRQVLDIVTAPEYFLLAYQDKFEGQDNTDFFTSMVQDLSSYEWARSRIDHLPKNNYLFGRKR